jgi:hypothetical protein
MPINGQCGFVFLNNVSAEGVARVAAHELGHGVFRLYHIFSSDNRYILPEGTTDNLMDYNGGTALYKYQWDYIHDPQTMLFAWAEEEEEGAMALNIIDAIKENNRLGLNSLKISDTWKKEESIQINLENLEIITVATKILKPKTTINTRAYTTEAIAKTQEVKVYFFDQYPITTDQQPVVTFQLAKAKLDKFLR